MLVILYEGHDNTECVKQFKKEFPKCKRTDASLKTKFVWLRTDVVAKLNNIPNEKTDADLAYEFLHPAFVASEDGRFFYLYSKCDYFSIKVGIKGSRVRYHPPILLFLTP